MSYTIHLSRDRRLKKLIDQHEPFVLTTQKIPWLYLCRSIISQQLSTKVASVINGRFLELYGGKTPKPQQVIDTSYEKLRSIGLSNAKTQYVQNVARFALEQGMDLKKLNRMKNEELIEYLTQIKGVGRWTVEMLLMFALGREDVFAVDDLGIQTAMKNIYRIDGSDKKLLRTEMMRISQKWTPYRTYACLHLWRWKDGG